MIRHFKRLPGGLFDVRADQEKISEEIATWIVSSG
jgi:hypothetical protein